MTTLFFFFQIDKNLYFSSRWVWAKICVYNHFSQSYFGMDISEDSPFCKRESHAILIPGTHYFPDFTFESWSRMHYCVLGKWKSCTQVGNSLPTCSSKLTHLQRKSNRPFFSKEMGQCHYFQPSFSPFLPYKTHHQLPHFPHRQPEYQSDGEATSFPNPFLTSHIHGHGRQQWSWWMVW